MKFGVQQQIWNSMTNMIFVLNSRWPTILKITFGNNSVANSPISVKICTGMQNSVAVEVT